MAEKVSSYQGRKRRKKVVSQRSGTERPEVWAYWELTLPRSQPNPHAHDQV